VAELQQGHPEVEIALSEVFLLDGVQDSGNGIQFFEPLNEVVVISLRYFVDCLASLEL